MEKQIEDSKLKEIFTDSKVIALVGASANKDKTSHIVMKYLIEFGYEVIPINPGSAGQEILGQMTFKSLLPAIRYRVEPGLALKRQRAGVPFLPTFGNSIRPSMIPPVAH